MPLDVLGRTRATLIRSASPLAERSGKSLKPYRDGDRTLQLLFFNEECLVSASHHLALITSLPFVHTARRSYRLDVLVKRWDWTVALVSSASARELR
jgi:hypothetical protein